MSGREQVESVLVRCRNRLFLIFPHIEVDAALPSDAVPQLRGGGGGGGGGEGEGRRRRKRRRRRGRRRKRKRRRRRKRGRGRRRRRRRKRRGKEKKKRRRKKRWKRKRMRRKRRKVRRGTRKKGSRVLCLYNTVQLPGGKADTEPEARLTLYSSTNLQVFGFLGRWGHNRGRRCLSLVMGLDTRRNLAR